MFKLQVKPHPLYLLQGEISVKSGVIIDREHTGISLDSAGRGVFTFDIQAVNQKPVTAGDLGEDFTIRETV